METSFDLALMDMENNPSNNNIKTWMMALAKTQVNSVDEMACMVTEMVEEMDTMQEEVKNKDKVIRKLHKQLDEQQTMVVSSVVVSKDKLEVKASSKEMKERLKIATIPSLR